jgi:hypothetical protein
MDPIQLSEPLSPRQRWVLFVSMALGVVAAGIAFAYKIAEFLFTLTADEVQGFADVPVTVYFAVAAGWLALLVWSFFTGKLTDVESAKTDFLRKEAEYERRGE